MSSVPKGPAAGQAEDPSIPHRISKFDLSYIAVRHDGALLLSLDDADGRDLTGREVVSFVVLGDAEADLARKTIEDTMYFAAARAVARLPKITSGKGGAE
jgi:hypothetical protein